MRPFGFSVIELLIAMVLVILLATTLLKTLRKEGAPTAAVTKGFEETLRAVMEQNGPVELSAFADESIEGSNKNGTFHVFMAGVIPQRSLQLIESNGKGTTLDRVAGARFTAYDENNSFLPDHPSASDLKRAKRVKVEINIHDAIESQNSLVNDGVHGVDLDGHPENGVAPVHERVFGIVLP